MDKVLFEVKEQIGLISLNAPKALNSLDRDMCMAMADKLTAWKNDDSIKAVILKGNGDKAFCAGGDVVSLYNSMKNNESYHKDFFKHEYHLDLMIHEYSKPIVCFARGIVMGGGIGIMNGSSHRIVTETTMMAMPEITIGLFPDVGGSYFLNQMPGNMGLFLGLTGARFYGADALYLNMADYFFKDEQLQEVENHLLNYEFTENPNQDVKDVIQHFSNKVAHDIPESSLKENQNMINELVSGDTIYEVDKNLRSYSGDDKIISRAVDTYTKGSPTSAFVIFEQIQRGKGKTIQEVFEMEGKMALNFGDSHDFPEGVRALLIDKDKNPDWKFKELSEITDVDKYFS